MLLKKLYINFAFKKTTVMKSLSTLLVLFAIFTSDLSAQKGNRWSLEPTGGVSFGHFDLETEISPVYGGNLRYALTPVFSLQANFLMGSFEDNGEDPFGRTFQNDYMQYALRSNIHLLRPFQFDAITKKINPFLIVGIGRLHNDVSGVVDRPPSFTGTNYSGEDLIYVFGGGLRFYLGSSFDLLLQYEYNYTNSDLIDGYNEPMIGNRFNDSYSFAMLGLAFKFGGAGPEHLDWAEKEDLALIAAQRATRRADQLDRDIKEMKADQDKRYDEEVKKMREEFEKQIKELQLAQDTISRAVRERGPIEEGDRVDPDRPGREVSAQERTVQQGKFYIIGGSFSQKDNAEKAVVKYAGQGYDSFIIAEQEKGNYRVVIEQHDDEFSARDALDQIRREVLNSAWMYAP